ncbi:general secretion pathway protein GspB [Massilia violaceinigra]|uniref:General secretion pathway protein GspB n=1 Tax=Massilia violaceinigra TaxID=2045208 RepID=A0ABY4A1Y5_9BURK|nr:general secretion pathway protein GspB [Massilia violaceinigra]UOD27704.1 general secretion pathway protein GspB [Massilia violaceinigra]
MSYILEALKKAQAERQLGNAPTIHATPIHAAEPERTGAGGKPVVIALALLALGATGAAVYAWKQTATPPAPVVQAAASATAPATAPAVPAPLPPPAPVPLPAAQPAPVVEVAPPPKPEPFKVAEVKPQPVKKEEPVKKEAPLKKDEPARTDTVKADKPVPSAEENLRTLRELPDALQHEIPPIAVGGYIYSRNPADRLLLIDKVLRREGDEVAPGLVLEKLLPKSAVMSYKGQRYRHPY